MFFNGFAENWTEDTREVVAEKGYYYGPENMKNLNLNEIMRKFRKLLNASHHYSKRYVVSHNTDWSRTIGVILLPRSPMGDVAVGTTPRQP